MIVSLPEEHAVCLDIAGKKKITLICTNEALPELISGYLYNGMVISTLDEISNVKISPDGQTAYVGLNREMQNVGEELRATGLGGIQLCAENVLEKMKINNLYEMSYIRRCAKQMTDRAVKYKSTGGVHCSALFNQSNLLSIFEDVGRHNTLDKIAGDSLLRGIKERDTLLITTGRISSDMVRKAGNIGTSIIASFSTPTQMAYDIALKANITLIGYLTKDRAKVFCGEERVLLNNWVTQQGA